MYTARPKGSAPKGFMPRTQIRTSSQRRDHKNNGEKEGSSTTTSKEYIGTKKKTVEMKVDTDEEQTAEVPRGQKESGNDIDAIFEEESPSRKPLSMAKVNQLTENGRIGLAGENMETKPTVKNDLKDRTTMAKSDKKGLEQKQRDITMKGDAQENEIVGLARNKTKNQFVKQKSAKEDDVLVTNKKDEDDSALKFKLEMEAKLRKQALERLAEENFSKGNKMFYYPEVVTPGQDIEVFLNKSLSALRNEPNVMIMGAFNDWRWKSFSTELSKTDLNGDWWSCQVHVPKEAYKADFVFFYGKDVYENNDTKDFCIPVEGGISVFEFEDFLLEEKRRELEKLAKEQAERERQAEEQRRMEVEKAAREADRAQAKREAERRRGMLQELMKKAIKSVDNLWYIEPSLFKGKDKVKLYYNKSSGPLANAKDIWIHGGYNNWKDGLSIVSMLVRSEKKEGDWWYADGRHEHDL